MDDLDVSDYYLDTIEKLLEENTKLSKLAYYDNLTGCYNRNWYLENYKNDDEFMFIMIDVNDLKKTNDSLGHVAGDKLIKEVADKLMSYGEVIRFGGDEFILIVDKDFDVSKIKDDRYSFGWELKNKDESLEECLRTADTYMYDHKMIKKRFYEKRKVN